ncbi:MAG: FkbM family methyltransferase [Candidatus Wallbacteria bacterium]
MIIDELKNKLKKSLISKNDYINEMYEKFHSHIFEYCKYLKNTDIFNITICNDGKIIFEFKNGLKMYCSEGDKRTVPIEIINFGAYEKLELDMMYNFVSEGDNIFDIGANVGWYSLNLSQKYKNIKIYAFEPIINTFQYFEDNIKLNNLQSKINLYNFGFSNENKKVEFFYSPECSVSASMKNITNNENVQKVECNLRKIDDFILDIGQNVEINFLKCDVEGAELFVFQGGINFLTKHKPIIFTEMLRKWSAKFNYHPNDIISLLKQINYKCFVIKDGKLLEIESIIDQTIETNFYFLNSEKHLNSDKIKPIIL